MTRFRHAEVLVQGHPVRYQTAGTGELVVFVHGLAGSTRWWARNAPVLAERYAVSLVNLPGFGSLRRRGPRFALAEAVDWLEAWIEAAGLSPCHVVAHSMGGYIVLRLAARRPDLVRRLILVAPAGLLPQRSLWRHARPLVAAGLAATPRFLPVLALDSLRAGPLTIVRAARDLLAEDVTTDLPAIAVPTLLVWGQRDSLIPPSIGPRMCAQLPDARLVVLDGAGHVAQYDRPREFNAAALAFLAGDHADA